MAVVNLGPRPLLSNASSRNPQHREGAPQRLRYRRGRRSLKSLDDIILGRFAGPFFFAPSPTGTICTMSALRRSTNLGSGDCHAATS
jgi:hypothetical protein